MSSSLGHYPGEKWVFDSAVVSCFDDMLARSIPDYANFRELCFYLGNKFIQPYSEVVDLGCSRGEALAPFIRSCDELVKFVGVECSEAMLQAARERFAGDKRVTILKGDLSGFYPASDASLVLSVFTLQFIPVVYRQRILRNVYNHLRPGGALILAEKIEGDTYITKDLLIDTYHGFKARNGYSLHEIEAKRRALEGVLTPITAIQYEADFLPDAGFKHVECFWRSLNFAAWIAIKND